MRKATHQLIRHGVSANLTDLADSSRGNISQRESVHWIIFNDNHQKTTCVLKATWRKQLPHLEIKPTAAQAAASVCIRSQACCDRPEPWPGMQIHRGSSIFPCRLKSNLLCHASVSYMAVGLTVLFALERAPKKASRWNSKKGKDGGTQQKETLWTYWALSVTTGRGTSSLMKSRSSVRLLAREMSMEVLLSLLFLTTQSRGSREQHFWIFRI